MTTRTAASDADVGVKARDDAPWRPRARRRSRAHLHNARPANDTVGALVIGGDYQGLGIARSLGRLGVPVCVVDDEHSIARFSRHVEHSVRVKDLRDERETVRTLLEVGRRLGLNGWVLFPTRDETVAALSRHRDELAEFFRVPTPAWDVVRWAWDKRNTYQLANELGIPTPKTWYPHGFADLDAIDAQPPFVIKPAIKENFVYATQDKAWRADSRDELERLFAEAAAIVGPGEVMIQEFDPRRRPRSIRVLRVFQRRSRRRDDGRAAGPAASSRVRPLEHVRGDDGDA